MVTLNREERRKWCKVKTTQRGYAAKSQSAVGLEQRNREIEKNIMDMTREAMVSSLLNTRDFCGDENEAFLDLCFDFRIQPTDEVRFAVFTELDKQWDMHRRQARR